MVRRDSGIQSLAQLAGKRVVTVKGGTQEPNMRKAVPSVEVITFETARRPSSPCSSARPSDFVNDEVSLLDAFGKLGAEQKDYVLLNGKHQYRIAGAGFEEEPTGAEGAGR